MLRAKSGLSEVYFDLAILALGLKMGAKIQDVLEFLSKHAVSKISRRSCTVIKKHMIENGQELYLSLAYTEGFWKNSALIEAVKQGETGEPSLNISWAIDNILSAKSRLKRFPFGDDIKMPCNKKKALELHSWLSCLSGQLNSQVHIVRALEVVTENCKNNPNLRKKTDSICCGVVQGELVSEAMSSQWSHESRKYSFPLQFINVIKWAEQNGQLREAVKSMADLFGKCVFG